MKTIVLAFFASASLAAWGQSYKVTGAVLDAKSKVPVEFATLWIEGSGIGTMTDSQGKWHSCISPWQYNHVIQRLWTL